MNQIGILCLYIQYMYAMEKEQKKKKRKRIDDADNRSESSDLRHSPTGLSYALTIIINHQNMHRKWYIVRYATAKQGLESFFFLDSFFFTIFFLFVFDRTK